MNGKIMQAIALIENIKLNYASSIYMYSSISTWRGDWELPQNELKEGEIMINKLRL
jgi:hypothetical protein